MIVFRFPLLIRKVELLIHSGTVRDGRAPAATGRPNSAPRPPSPPPRNATAATVASGATREEGGREGGGGGSGAGEPNLNS